MLATDDRSNAKILGAIGSLSGTVAWLLINLIRVGGVSFDVFLLSRKIWLAPWSLLPGAVFGLVIGVLLRRRGKLTGFRQAGYAAAALVAYFCAFHVAMHTVPVGAFALDPSKDALRMGIAGIAAGLAGSVLLGAMTICLLKAPGRLVLRLPVLVGTVAGALLSLMAHDHTEWGWSQLILLALWQGAYAAALAPVLRRETELGSGGKAATGAVRGRLAGAILVLAVFASGEPEAQAMAPKPEDIADAGALMAAPWLACKPGPNPDASIPAGMTWNWESRQFQLANSVGIEFDFSTVIILFDNEKRRARIIVERQGSLEASPAPFVVHHARGSMAIFVDGERDEFIAAFVISRRRTANGGFLAVLQSSSLDGFLFSDDPQALQLPLSCAQTADDALTQQIEQARVEWLTPAPPDWTPQP